MKKILLLALIFTSYVGYGCGWYPTDDLYFFYNLFNQENIAEQAYYPFLREDANVFYHSDDQKQYHDGNVALWEKILTGWSKSDIHNMLLPEDQSAYDKIWVGKSSSKEKDAKKYMDFARECSQVFESRKRASWEYRDILKENSPDASYLLEEGADLWKKASDDQLKLRYSYQLVRIFHYTGQYQGAIDFYEANVSGKFSTNEMYYYMLDQLAGCYYSLGNYDKAAYLYLQVFNNSVDRKTSAYLSYRFCNYKGGEGRSFFTSKQDEAGYITLKGIGSFGNDLRVLEELKRETPNENQLELIFMRSVNNLERSIWPTRTGVKEKLLPILEDGQDQKAQALYEFAVTMTEDKEVKNGDFWKLSVSYLSFCKGDVANAQKQLAKLKAPQYEEQIDVLERVYKVFSWNEITPEREAFLATFLGETMTQEGVSGWSTMEPSWKYLIMDQVAHLYFKHNQVSKAFLVHNRIENINRLSSLKLIDDLIQFASKSTKNKFEQMLMRKTVQDNNDPVNYLRYAKGLHFLRQGQPEEAYSYLKNNTAGHDLDQTVSAKVFSNNIAECFNCTDDIMEDLVYQASPFSFIEANFSLADLASHLIKLKDMSQNDQALWKRKLAYYLLANYYFNVSNTGYYRGLLIGRSNCCNYDYTRWKYSHRPKAKDVILEQKGYNLLDIDEYYEVYYQLASKSYGYYRDVINLSQDKELNARCLYMMAKCELNEAYDKSDARYSYSYYNGSLDGSYRNYKKSFEELNNEYKNTKFYQQIIAECSYFEIYTNL